MSLKDIDNHKLMYHPCRVADWRNGIPIYPLQAEIGVTNRCNHKCKFCALDWITHGKDDMDTQNLVTCLADMSELGVKSVYFAGEGEPTLHKDLSVFIARASSFGMKTGLSKCAPSLSRWTRSCGCTTATTARVSRGKTRRRCFLRDSRRRSAGGASG